MHENVFKKSTIILFLKLQKYSTKKIKLKSNNTFTKPQSTDHDFKQYAQMHNLNRLARAKNQTVLIM